MTRLADQGVDRVRGHDLLKGRQTFRLFKDLSVILSRV